MFLHTVLTPISGKYASDKKKKKTMTFTFTIKTNEQRLNNFEFGK